MKPAVIYPYKFSRSKELEWSLKSLRNVEHGDVYIVGDTPPYEVEATLIHHKSKIVSPNHNQIMKYKLACESITDEFVILCNDDFYILEPWDLTNFNMGQISDISHKNKADYYIKSLQSTEIYLRSNGLNTLSYELHVPMLVSRVQLLAAINELVEASVTKDVLLRSYYGNRFNIESVYLDDCKHVSDFNRPFLSSTESSFMGSMGNYVRDKVK